MAKEIAGYVKLQIKGGQANPAPPVGPALGQRGINIMEFCKAFNEKTKAFMGKPVPVVITVYKDKKFKMVLVSLDFKSQIENSLIPFIDKHKLSAEVIVLSDPNANEWINKVNNEWSGSIPATIIYNKYFYYFHEGSMDYNELNEIITKNLK